jgi:NAD(P)-dependent dehydrogenase (short-subunit alcohol dehydrogenase family)
MIKERNKLKGMTMSKNLIGKVAIVTGGSKGIGASIAEELAEEGASVVVNYSTSKEEAGVFELGPQTNAFYHHPDITCLLCPLPDVGLTVHSLLTQPAMILS